MEIIPLFTGFFTSQVVVWDFSHQVGSASCFFRLGAMGQFFFVSVGRLFNGVPIGSQ